MTLLAEDLLLLLLDDESGAPSGGLPFLDYGLAGAVLVELALTERVTVADDPKPRRRHVAVTDGAPTGDPVLDFALATVAAKPVTAQRLVPKLAKGLRDRLLDGLVAGGVLRENSDRVLGIFPRHRWPAVDGTQEAALRGRLHDVLITGVTPDQRTAALISVLSSMDYAHKVLDNLDHLEKLDRATRKQVRARAKVIAEGEWAGAAVRAAIQAAQAATTAAVLAATSAATVAST